MKKIVSCLTIAIMLIASVPGIAFASEDSCNHVWTAWNYYNEEDENLTCLEQTMYRECEECYTFEEKVIPATTEHVWTEWYRNNSYYSCEDVYDYSFCDVCEKKTKVIITPAKEKHTWGEWNYDTDYTCIERTGERQCEVCYEYEYKTFSPTSEHNWNEWALYEGYPCSERTAYRDCTDCGASEEKIVAATEEHTWSEWTNDLEATCTRDGHKERYCEVCMEWEEYDIPATGKHNWSKWEPYEGASCITGGQSYRWCMECDKEEFKEFPKTGAHKMSGWLVYSEASTKWFGYLINACKDCTYYKDKIINQIKTVKLSAASYTYNGKAKKPTVTVKDDAGKKLVKGTDYTVKYKNAKGKVVANPVNVGKYKAVIKFKGKYTGTVVKNFTIKPKATAIKSLKAGDNSVVVKWNKKTAQVTGYQIRYSTSSKFTNGATKYTLVKNNKTVNKTIKKLKDKKTYYVQIRTYKNVNGTKVYSDWSKTKSVKTY